MLFAVFTPQGDVLYNGGSWPMARAALDSLVLVDDLPQLTTRLEPETDADEP